jgi:hypothetical protein
VAASQSAYLAKEAGRFCCPQEAKLLNDRHEPANALIKQAEDWLPNFMSPCSITSLFILCVCVLMYVCILYIHRHPRRKRKTNLSRPRHRIRGIAKGKKRDVPIRRAQ